jgi:hypothetical protein
LKIKIQRLLSAASERSSGIDHPEKNVPNVFEAKGSYK